MKLPPIEISKKELQEVLVEFKRKAYAGSGNYEIIPIYGLKKFESEIPNWLFIDEYSGDASFAGIERLSCLLARDAITETGSFKVGEMKEIWHMVYLGRLLNKTAPKETVYDFLRQPLRVIPVDLPFRGPIGRFSNRNFPSYFAIRDFPGFEYQNELIDGIDVTSATGVEKIFFDEEEVYRGFWGGGLSMKNLKDIILI